MKKLFLALPLFLAACQSERVAFRFQPVHPAASTAPAGPRNEAAPTAPGTIPAPLPRATAPAEALVAAPAATGRRPAMPTGLAALAERPTLPTITAIPTLATAPQAVARLLPRRLLRQHATAGPARTTENGLGGIALFFIAIVLGLLAGLGALVSLIPGISFLGGVGLAAAGLLVLFGLYSLLSGGGKKPRPTK